MRRTKFFGILKYKRIVYPCGSERDLEELGIGERVETIQTATLLRSAGVHKGKLERHAVSKTPVRACQLTLV